MVSYNTTMTSENVKHKIERHPFVPIRLHLASGKEVDIHDPASVWFQRNALLVTHRLPPGSEDVGNYDVIAFDLIERIEQLNGNGGKNKKKRRRQ
jgi:hypothetical protein